MWQTVTATPFGTYNIIKGGTSPARPTDSSTTSQKTLYWGPACLTGKQLPNESARHPRQHLQPILRKTNFKQNSCLTESVRHGFCLKFAGRDQTTLPRKLLQNSEHAQNCLKRPCGPGAWQHGGPSNRPNNGLKPLSCPIYRRSVTAALPSR